MLDSSNDPAALGDHLGCGVGSLSWLAAALVLFCLATVPGAAATTAPATTKPVDAGLLDFLVAENAKTVNKILTQQYHTDETEALLPVIPERAIHADVVREGANARWRIQIPLKNKETGVISPVTFNVIQTKAGAMTWHENTAQAMMYEADENGALPERTMKYIIHTQEPVDVLQVVAAQGDGGLAKCIAVFSSPPRHITAERDVKDPNIFYITMFAPEFNGPRTRVVLDASKGYLMTRMTSYWAPGVLAEEVRVELGQMGADRLWFPISYERIGYSRETPKSVTGFRTSRLSNIVLNETLPSDAFNISCLNFPDGLKVNVHPVVGKDRLMVWFKGALLDEDAYMAEQIKGGHH